MTSTIALTKSPGIPGKLRSLFVVFVKYLAGIILCLTPFTAVIVLGWLSRKTASDVERRQTGQALASWPNFIGAEKTGTPGHAPSIIASLIANMLQGIKSWIAILALTLPFSLVWLAGWFAGWENSFSKGYELSGVWPLVSLAAVLVSLPVLTLLPMAIAHQAVCARISAIFEFREIANLVRSAGWSYLALSLLIGIGAIGILGVRALPVFAEQFSLRVASGSPEAIHEFAQQYKLGVTALLFTGLLIMRHVMARVYARAIEQSKSSKGAGRIKTGAVFLLTGLLWLGSIFLIYVAQFVNYSAWSWLNQPVFMLPWIGII